MKYRAFISYRRQDASAAARWLREKLLGFRPPKELLERVSPEQRVDLERRVAYFLDTSYQSANEDFWTSNIEPALKESEYLIVISSPSALLTRPDGSDNWVAREIDTFLKVWGEAEGRRRIIVVLAAGASEEIYPGCLNELSDKWDWADLRDVSRLAAMRPGATERLGDALLKIVARIHEVPQELLPILRREEARKRGRLRMAIGALAAVVIIGLSGVSWWALSAERESARQRVEAERQRDEARRGQARLIAQLATITLDRGDFGTALALALEALPRSRDDHKRLYVPEAERALRDVVMAPMREVRALNIGRSSMLDLANGGLAVLADEEEVSGKDGQKLFTTALRVLDVIEGRTLAMLRGHLSRVTHAVVSDDGRLLLSGGEDGTARLWDIAGNRQIAVFPDHVHGYMDVALSHDGKHAATASQDGTVRLWQATGGESRIIVRCDPLQRKDPPRLLFAPDDRHLAIGCQSGVHLWAVERDHEVVLSSPPWSTSWIYHPQVIFAGSRLFAGGFNRARHGPIVWDVETGALRTIHTSGDTVSSLDASKDGTHVVASLYASNAMVWTVGKDEPVILRHSGMVLGAKMLSDGMRLVTVTDDGTARLWDISGRQLGLWRGFPGSANLIALSKDEKAVAIADSNRSAVHVWEFANHDVRVLPSPAPSPPGIIAMAVSPDRSRLAAAYRDGRVYVWNTTDTSLITSFDSGMSRNLATLAFSPDDGSRLLIAASSGADAGLWNAVNGTLIARLSDSQRRGRSRLATFAGNGKLIATGDKDVVMLWDGQTGVHRKSLAMPASVAPDAITHLSMPHDGRRVLAIGRRANDGAFGQIWSGDDWTDVVPVQRNEAWRGALFSPDGTTIVVVRGDEEVRLLGPRGEDGELFGIHPFAFRTMYAPNNRTILTASAGEVRVWWDQEDYPSFRLATETLDYAAFSPDSTRLLVVAPGPKLLLWDIASRSLMATLPTDDYVTRIQFTTDSIAAGSEDGSLYLWRYPPTTESLIEYACAMLTRPLSSDQRRAFLLGADPEDPPCNWHPDMKEKPPYVPKAAGR